MKHAWYLRVFIPASQAHPAVGLINPVVLIHGWADNPDVLRLWKEAEEALKARGVDVFVPTLPPINSIRERSESLVEQLERKYASKRLHFIAHSMVSPPFLATCQNRSFKLWQQGGLNARDIAYCNGDHSFTVLMVCTLVGFILDPSSLLLTFY